MARTQAHGRRSEITANNNAADPPHTTAGIASPPLHALTVTAGDPGQPWRSTKTLTSTCLPWYFFFSSLLFLSFFFF